MAFRAALAGLALMVLAAAPSALAHTGDGQPISGTIELAPGETHDVAIAGMMPKDILEWSWTTAGAGVTADLVWLDATGASHRVDSAGLTVGRFVAPADLSGAFVQWKNAGDAPASVNWEYVCYADFWSQPGMIIPAASPFILLGGALVAGRAVDAFGRPGKVP